MMRRVASGSGSTNLFHAIVASEKTKSSAATRKPGGVASPIEEHAEEHGCDHRAVECDTRPFDGRRHAGDDAGEEEQEQAGTDDCRGGDASAGEFGRRQEIADVGDVRQREEEHLEQKVVHCSGGIARRREQQGAGYRHARLVAQGEQHERKPGGRIADLAGKRCSRAEKEGDAQPESERERTDENRPPVFSIVRLVRRAAASAGRRSPLTGPHRSGRGSGR